MLFLFCWLYFALSISFGQGCAAEVSAKELAYLSKKEPMMRSFNSTITRGVRDFPIKANIVAQSDGSGGLSKQEVIDAIKDMNQYFIQANIRFILLDGINEISSDRYYNFNSSHELELTEKHDIKHVINLYFFNAIYKFGTNVCGYAPYPNEYSASYLKDRIMVRNDCVRNGASLIHEMGHYFSLFHTHGNSTAAKDKELVTREKGKRNCETAGDGLCDTPADPRLNGKVDGECQYTGADRDPAGVKYQPNPRNVMAYSVIGCRNEFSKGQFARINYAALQFRDYIKFPEGAKPLVVHEKQAPVHLSELNSTTPSKQPTQPSIAASTKPTFEEVVEKKEEPAIVSANSKTLSGELTLQMASQKVATTLDGNLFKADEAYYTGTNYQLFIKNNEPAYVYVVGSDLTRDNSLLYPLEYNSPKLNDEFSKFALPGKGGMYTMNEVPGKDYLLVLYSTKPLPIKNMIYQMEREDGNFVQRLYQVMGDDLVPLNQVTYHNEGSLGFKATTADRSIVPIILEINHL